MKEVQQAFDAYLLASISQHKYVKLQYFTDIHEFMTVMSVTEQLLEIDGVSFLLLNTGEKIKLKNIVRIDHFYAPQYAHIADFSCDC